MDRVSTNDRRRTRHTDSVSIPRSGWIVFQQRLKARRLVKGWFQSLVRDGSCFNQMNTIGLKMLGRFQSLVRDGSCFNRVPIAAVTLLVVSIPRSGWIVFQRNVFSARHGGGIVSIPRSGWIVFQRDRLDTLGGRDTVSIPRSGWIVFQRPVTYVSARVPLFQSLVRDGSCFNFRPLRDQPERTVSIPRSGWIVFQRCNSGTHTRLYSFNPSFGMDRVST